jgi:hypothetical protein
VADDQSDVRQPLEVIDRELSAEVTRLSDRKLLTRSQTEELWSAFRSMEAAAASRLLAASTSKELSAADQVRAGLRARMWLATVIESEGTEHERAVAIRRRIVALEKSLGVFEEPRLAEPPTA